MRQSNFFTKLTNFSVVLNRTCLLRHLFFVALTAATIGFLGYYFGTFDQASHIPFLKKYADPSLFPGDSFLNLRNLHFSYFWLLFLPFYRTGTLEISLFITHIFITYLTFWAIWRLSKTLFNNPLASVLSVVVFIVPHIGFGGFTLFEFSLLNRTFVLPFLIIAIDWYLQSRYVRSFFVLGILYNLHVISVNFILFMFIFDMIMRFKKSSPRLFILTGIAFLISASPVLIWKLTSTPVDFGRDNHEWFITIQRMLYHLFNLISANPNVLFLTAGGISSIIIFFMVKKTVRTPHHQIITHFVYAAIIVVLAQVLATAFFPATIIVQLQIIRIGLFIVLFSYLYVAQYIAQKINSYRFDEATALCGAFIFSPTPIILLGVLWFKKIIHFTKAITFSTLITVFVIFILLLVVAFNLNLWQPGIFPFGPTYSSYYQIQEWVREHTDKKAIFITPPYKWWLYEVEWRVISERQTVVTLSELLEAAFAPEYISGWKARFEDVAPKALSQFGNDVFDNFKITKKSYMRLTVEDFKKLSRKYHARYAVVEKPTFYNLPITYQNKNYTLYEIGN